MTEPPQITGLGQNGQCVDRPDAGNCAQQLVIWPLAKQFHRPVFDGPVFDGIALADQASSFGQHEAE